MWRTGVVVGEGWGCEVDSISIWLGSASVTVEFSEVYGCAAVMPTFVIPLRLVDNDLHIVLGVLGLVRRSRYSVRVASCLNPC